MTVFYALYGAYAVVFGLIAGSFANVAIARWPAGASVWPRSACPRCGAPIRARDNVPVLSFVLLRGVCRDCAAPIPRSYPLIEALMGVLALLLYRRLMPAHGVLDAQVAASFGVGLLFLTLLIVGIYSDLRHYLLPDEVTIYAAPLGIAAAALLEWLVVDAHPGVSVRESVLAAVGAGGVFAAVAVSGHAILRREALGWGDVKWMVMIGSFLGMYTWVALLIGTSVGAAAHLLYLLRTGRSAPLPYGPSLGFGAIVTLLWGDVLLEAYFPGMAKMIEVLRR